MLALDWWQVARTVFSRSGFVSSRKRNSLVTRATNATKSRKTSIKPAWLTYRTARSAWLLAPIMARPVPSPTVPTASEEAKPQAASRPNLQRPDAYSRDAQERANKVVDYKESRSNLALKVARKVVPNPVLIMLFSATGTWHLSGQRVLPFLAFCFPPSFR